MLRVPDAQPGQDAYLVCDLAIWERIANTERRSELLGWMRLNGLDPDTIPASCPVTVERRAGSDTWVICHSTYHTEPGGKLTTRERRTPVLFDPPLYLLSPITGARTKTVKR